VSFSTWPIQGQALPSEPTSRPVLKNLYPDDRNARLTA